MLLERWLETLERFRELPAIYDGSKIIRFSDLAEALAEQPRASTPLVARGTLFEIAVATLRGWRDGQAILPIERRDTPPELPASLDPQIAHLKRVPGTDGAPHFAYFTASQIAADADRVVTAMSLSPETPNLAAVSIAHSYGYSNILLPLLLHGIPVQTLEVPFPAVVVEAMKAHERIVVPAVPSMWRAWHRSGILNNAPISLALSAGAPLSAQLEQLVWEKDQLKLHNFYGASECGGISWDASDTPREDGNSLGTPLPGVDISLDDAGHFVVRSDSAGIGYLPHEATGVLVAGTFHTPDSGHLKNGELILDARGNEAINVAGRKLGPGRIEKAIKDSGLTDRATVFGLPSNDPERVDEVAVLLAHGTDVKALRQAISKTLAGWQLPRHWFQADDESLWNLSRSELRLRFKHL